MPVTAAVSTVVLSEALGFPQRAQLTVCVLCAVEGNSSEAVTQSQEPRSDAQASEQWNAGV